MSRNKTAYRTQELQNIVKEIAIEIAGHHQAFFV